MSKGLEIESMVLKRASITLVGESPLICHKFSEKARKEMLDKQQKKSKTSRATRDPEAEFLASLYEIPEHPGVYGFPAMAFKKAAIRGAKSIPDIAMTDARGFFHILCDDHMLLPLEYKDLRCVEDVVRIGRGSADLRYRGYFYGWIVRVPIKYNAGVVSLEQIITMFNIAGFSVGVGDWRPEKDGMYGRFRVGKEVERYD